MCLGCRFLLPPLLPLRRTRPPAFLACRGSGGVPALSCLPSSESDPLPEASDAVRAALPSALFPPLSLCRRTPMVQAEKLTHAISYILTAQK